MDVVDEYLRRAPVARLRPFIPWYSGYRQRGLAPTLHRGLPSVWLTLILTLDEPLIATALPERHPGGRFDSYVGGLHRTAAMIVHQGAQSGIQVAVSPLGCRRLFGPPAGELAGQNLRIEELLGRTGVDLHERVQAAAGWQARFAVLDRFLSARLDRVRSGRGDPPAQVARAWSLIRSSHGRVGVAGLAAAVDWSPRSLAQRFTAEIGLGPKTAARVARFDTTRRLLAHRVAAAGGGVGGSAGLARLAADCGYADQAHLSREFVEMSGLSPRRWLAAEGIRPDLPNSSSQD